MPIIFLTKSRKQHSKFHMEPQKLMDNQNNIEQNAQSCRNHITFLQNIPKSCNNQTSFVMAKKRKKNRPMEQNEEHRNKSIPL